MTSPREEKGDGSLNHYRYVVDLIKYKTWNSETSTSPHVAFRQIHRSQNFNKENATS